MVPEYVSRYYPQPGVSFLSDPNLGPCSVEVAALRSRQLEPLIAGLIGRRRPGHHAHLADQPAETEQPAGAGAGA